MREDRDNHAVTQPGVDPLHYAQPIDRTVFLIVLVLEAGSLITCGAIIIGVGASPWLLLVLLACAALPLLLLKAARLRVRLADDHLRWTFWPFWAGRVPYDDIETAKPITLDAMGDFGGWGPKLSWDFKRFGAVAASGPAVEIARVSKERTFVLTCPDAETLAAELLERALATQGEPSPAGASPAPTTEPIAEGHFS
jgi:hypothetical protein